MAETAQLSAASGSALKPSQKLRVLMASGPGCWLQIAPGFAAALLAEVTALEKQGDTDLAEAQRQLDNAHRDLAKAQRQLDNAHRDLEKADLHLTHAVYMLILSAVVAGFALAMFLGAI